MRKKLFFSVLIGLLLHAGLTAQFNLINAMLKGGSNFDVFFNITPLPGDELLLIGYSYSNDGDLSNNEGMMDIWLLHLDANYNVVLNTTLGGNGSDWGAKAFFIPGSGYYIVGNNGSTGGGIVTSNYGVQDVWIIHLDTSGNLVWQEVYGGSQYDEVYDAIIDSSGDLVLVGSSSSSDHDLTGNYGSADAWVVKINPNTGQIVWQKNIGGTGNEYLFAIKENQNTGEYVIGGFTTSADHDLSGANYHNSYDALLATVDYNGNLTWIQSFGGTNDDILYGLTLDNQNNIYFVTYSNSTDGDISNNLGLTDVWLVKIDGNSKNIDWEKNFGGSDNDYGFAIIFNSAGNLMFAGKTASNDGDVSNLSGAEDMWIVEVDLNGNLIQEKTFGGTGNDTSNSLVELSNGHFVAGGFSLSNDGDFSNMNHGSADGAIVTFIKATNNMEKLADEAWKIYPVPAESHLQIMSEKPFTTVEIFDITGHAVQTFDTHQTDRLSLDISQFKPGSYLLKISGNDFYAVKKMMIK